MIQAAKANGVDTVFGIPGAQIYPLFDALYRDGDIQTIITRHEQGAAYMAFGYAKATGRVGTFSVVPGPGVLNTTAALCTAMGCNTPVLCLTGQVPSTFLGQGRGHLHELADQRATLASIVKWAERIEDPADTQSITNEAFHRMLSGRPGPVSLEMCWDTMAKPWEVEVGQGGYSVDKPEADLDAIAEAASILASAKNVMIMCGGGAQDAGAEVAELAELLNAPVTAFRSGRGVVSEDHELGVNSLAARLLWDQTDVIVGVGTRLEMQYMRWGNPGVYSPDPGGPTLIRIDIDPKEMDRLKAAVGIVADSAEACRLLADKLSTMVGSRDQSKRDQIAEAKANAQKLMRKVQPQVDYWNTIRDVLPRDGLVVPELSQMGFTSYFGLPIYQPRTYITEGFQGTLGFGFNTALGAKVGQPDKAVLSVTGDGGFMFGVQELATAVANNIGLVTLIFNNKAFGNVRRDQQTQYESRIIGGDLINPDFVKMAESFGAAGYRVDSPEALKPVLQKAIDDSAPCLIDVQVERGSEVSPWEFIMMDEAPKV